jgi:hypothetical protein
VVGLNYQALVFPLALIMFILICLSIYSLLSLVARGYWVQYFWPDFTGDRRLFTFLYFIVLLLITILTIYTAMKVTNYPGQE